MTHRFEAQPAYILHARPYQESSLLLELFTRDFGRIAAIARGAKRKTKGGNGVLQPFVPLLVACSGKGELLTLKNFESESIYPMLMARRLMSALYLNELLMRLLYRWDAHLDLFHFYQTTLRALEHQENEQVVLRLFEKELLKAIGYGLQLTVELDSGQPVQAEQHYLFNSELGPSLLHELQMHGSQSKHHGQNIQKLVFKGKSLLALDTGDLSDPSCLQDAKRLMRESLGKHLGVRPLETRKLFL